VLARAQDYMQLEPILATVRFLPSSVTGFILNVRPSRFSFSRPH